MTHNVIKMRLRRNGTWEEQYKIFPLPVSELTAHKTTESLMKSTYKRSDIAYIIVREGK